MTADCGGCRGEGNHRKHCPRHPYWTIYLVAADKAEDIGDTIGSNDTGLANLAYSLAGHLKARHREALEVKPCPTCRHVMAVHGVMGCGVCGAPCQKPQEPISGPTSSDLGEYLDEEPEEPQ